MLTVKEVAERWKVSVGMIYKLVEGGRLPCHRIGKAIRFAEEHLQEFLKSASQEKSRQAFSHLDLSLH